MSRQLVIVGASARACAESAIRAGYSPRSFDLFADMDLRATGPVTRLSAGYRELDSLFPPGDDPWMYTGGLENHPRLVDNLCRRRPLWGIAGRALRWARRPWRWCAVLRDAGLPVPDWRPVSGASLLKPLAGAAGKGIRPWTGGDHPAAWRAFRQEMVFGDPVAALFCGFHDRVELLGVTRQRIGGPAGPFSYRGSVGPIDPGPAIATIRRMGETLGRALGLRGLFGVDGIMAEGVFFPVEINPRYTASAEVIERATGVPSVAWQAAAFGAGPVPETVPPRCVVAKEILYAERDTAISSDLGAIPGVSDIPEPGSFIPAGWPILTVVAEGASEREAERCLGVILNSCVKLS